MTTTASTATLPDPPHPVRDAMADAPPLAEIGDTAPERDCDRLEREARASATWFSGWLRCSKNSKAYWSADHLYDHLVRRYKQRKIAGKAKRHRIRHRIIALMPHLQQDWDSEGILRFAPHLYPSHFWAKS
jgi:hypothetical protein